MAYAEQTNYGAPTTASPKQRPELRERVHSFQAAVEQLDFIQTRLLNMRDRLCGSAPSVVADSGSALIKGGQIDPPLLALYAGAAEDIENRISRIRSTIEDIERVI